ncbi:MAG: hypothetical protein JWL61_1192 [Gemmatimonadetes bacterium]|nr:hypothetical protein [Gemmatimonadota bacterium]
MANSSQAVRTRIESVDVVRGVIMVIMALDHTRDYFGMPGANPTNLASTTAALFFARWITHFCAPTFFLLTGTGAYLSLSKQTPRQLSRFLFTRGLWLIFLEIIVLRFMMQFNVDYRVTMLTVLWALGWAMITLSALVFLRPSIVAAIGVVLIAGHNAFDGVTSANPFWSFLHSPGFLLNSPDHVVFISYPIIPWIGVTAVGYALGQIYSWPAERRRQWLVRAGIAVTAAFFVLRGVNVYGDPVKWAVQTSATFTLISFFNLNKYPPSLLFLLMTLGPVLLFLRAVDAKTPAALRPAMSIGKVPMFYFLLHFPLIHLIAVAVCYALNGSAHWMFESPGLDKFPFTTPPVWGFPLPIVYLVWASVVIVCYPLSKWFAGVKQRRPDLTWLSYL